MFFDLKNKQDLKRTKQIINYIENSELINPLPIKYQLESNHRVPLLVKLVVPNYGTDAIWSYWGAQYITLLADCYEATKDPVYLAKAKHYLKIYKTKIVEHGGFAETFDIYGDFMKHGLYKSIRITGWIVQYEHAVQKTKLY